MRVAVGADHFCAVLHDGKVFCEPTNDGLADLWRRTQDELAGAVGDEALDPRLELAARDVDGAWDDAFLPFLALAHVDEERVALALAGRGCADLVDLALHLGEQLSVRRHLLLKR